MSNHHTNPEKPLVTLALFTYNQEKYIREAVEGALAQTYSPLEIILSDDCSTDRTFEIMQEMASAYKGPHKFILNRNTINFGIGKHVSKVLSMCNGKLICAAAGDDISMPHRVENIVDSWRREGEPVCAIYSDVDQINESGEFLETTRGNPDMHPALFDILKGKQSVVIGCSECWHRELFDLFGPLGADVVNEDSAMWFRAALIGRVIHIQERLVKHRLHNNNTGSGGFTDKLNGNAWISAYHNAMVRESALLRNYLADLVRFRQVMNNQSSFGEIETLIHRKQRFVQAAHNISKETSIARWKWVFSYYRNSLNTHQRMELPKLLWPRAYRAIRQLVKKLNWAT